VVANKPDDAVKSPRSERRQLVFAFFSVPVSSQWLEGFHDLARYVLARIRTGVKVLQSDTCGLRAVFRHRLVWPDHG
jgi:hypothetical protein